MADGPRHDPDRELFGQGLANIAAPIFGGMPATGAIARTAVNVRAGARTRVAAIVHSVALILVVLLGSAWWRDIPLAALAGVLMVTAVRMVEIRNVRAILRSTRSDALVLVLTAVATVVFDLIVAVEIGVAAAAILALRNVARTTALTRDPARARGRHRRGARPAARAHRRLPHRRRAVLRRGPAIPHRPRPGRRRPRRHPSAAGPAGARRHRRPGTRRDRRRPRNRHITVLLKGPRPEHERLLRAVGALDHLASEHHIFANLDEAVAHAHLHASNTTHDPTSCSVPKAA